MVPQMPGLGRRRSVTVARMGNGGQRTATAAAVEARPAAPPATAERPGARCGAAPGPTPRAIHRWRDLDGRQRLWAVAVGAALLLAPLVAFVHFLPVWSPQADPALMALRALDTGTSRTPLLGQPSQSGLYAESVASVHHPGPLHFYLLALPIRVIGGTVGMLVVSVAITGACLVTSAWAVFRQLGRTAGVVAALALAAVAFTTGASSLVHPVSSNIAGYPLLLSAVLCWCVAAGDIRLLPLATAAVSFTAQQHLSVVPATVVIAGGSVVLLALRWRREGRWRDPESRRSLRRAAGRSGIVALVLWTPVLVQQAFGDSGNLSRIVWFARHDARENLGPVRALWQAAHALGLPPLLGRTEVTGTWLISRPTAVTWLSAAAVIALVTLVCLRWRTREPRRASLGAMTALVLAAGLYNGASVPAGLEQARLSFYHWTFVLSFFVALVIGLAVVEPLVRAARPALARRRHMTTAVAAVVVLAVAAPSAVNPHLDRITNDPRTAGAPLDPDVVHELVDAVVARGDAIGPHPLVLTRNDPQFAMYAATLSFALVERGVDVRFSLADRFFVHDSRLVDRDDLTWALIFVVDREVESPTPPGELIAEVDLESGLAVDDYRALVAAAEAADGEVVLGDELAASLSDDERALAVSTLERLLDDPDAVLLNPDLLAFLADNPPLASPALDPERAARVLASIEGRSTPWRPGTPTSIRAYLLDRDEVLATASPAEIGRAGRS
jgi:hypothetical protein